MVHATDSTLGAMGVGTDIERVAAGCCASGDGAARGKRVQHVDYWEATLQDRSHTVQ